MATKTADTIETPPAPADDPGITIALEPDEESLELKDEGEEAAPVADVSPSKPEPKKEPEAKTAEPPAEAKAEPVKSDVTPEAKVESKPEPLHPAVREERAKRKAYDKERQFYKAQWEETEREVQRLQARLQQAGMETKAQPIKVPQERIAALEAKADKAEGLGKVAGLTLEETAKLIEEHDQVWSQRFSEYQFRMGVKLSEVSARARHSDYDEVLSRGGVFDAMAQRPDGSYPNPILARMILQDPDPGERAYIIGRGRLIALEDAKAEGEKAEAAPDTPVAQATPVKEPAKVEAPPAAKDIEAEAERRGARAVVEKVAVNSQKAKGISQLRKAGPVGKTATWTREELDALMRTNPTKYMELVGRYPELDRYHLG